jgi:chromatin remodeling complex protein RSC6
MPKANSAFMKPMNVSDDLAAVVGKGPMPRSEVVKKLWAYIKKNKLQDEKNKRNINSDDKLKKVFGGKGTVNMFEMTKLVSKHLSSDEAKAPKKAAPKKASKKKAAK